MFYTLEILQGLLQGLYYITIDITMQWCVFANTYALGISVFFKLPVQS